MKVGETSKQQEERFLKCFMIPCFVSAPSCFSNCLQKTKKSAWTLKISFQGTKDCCFTLDAK